MSPERHHEIGRAAIAGAFALGTFLTSTRITAASHLPWATSVHVYYVAVGDRGRTGTKIGCGDSLVAVTRTVVPTTAPLTAALRILLGDHHKYYGQSGLYNALYRSRLSVQSAIVRRGTATVRLRGTTRLGGECDDPRAIAQLRSTVLQFTSIHRAMITINGVPIARKFSGKG